MVLTGLDKYRRRVGVLNVHPVSPRPNRLCGGRHIRKMWRSFCLCVLSQFPQFHHPRRRRQKVSVCRNLLLLDYNHVLQRVQLTLWHLLLFKL
jgi:hypothetical protein